MKADFEVGIIGAGFAGLIAALQLKKAGKESFVIFERATEIGGTWRDNIYPGCACDIASPLYSFAEAPNAHWTQLYASQPEIHTYLKKVAADRNLYAHIRFRTDVREARFLKDRGCWEVLDQKGNVITVRVLLAGMGPLNRPVIPPIKGLEKYRGRYFHTSNWVSNYDLKGKRVAVIGTGASAVQVIPNIAPSVQHLLVLQRTPAWVMDRFDKKISLKGQRLYERFPAVQKLKRELIYWIGELFGLGFIGNRAINRVMTWIALWKLRREVKDPELRKKLTPRYMIGCKRILKSDDYYPTFNRPNVALVTEAIERFTSNGIETKDGTEHVVDAVIFATGFEAADLNLYTKIYGLQGKNLIDVWKSTGAEAYLGTVVSGYPNLAMLLGPNTGLGHNSVVHIMESQMNYVMQYINFITSKTDDTYLDIKPEVQTAYNAKLQLRLKKTVWASGCKSWYINSHGKNTTVYPGLTVTFRRQTRRFDPGAYTVVTHAAQITSLEPIIA